MTQYLLDANVFIEAKNSYYSFDLAPAFWDWIQQAHQDGKLFTIQKVTEEITRGGDELATWLAGLPDTFSISATADDQPSLHAVANWAGVGNNFNDAAVAQFLSSADYYLVAQALTLGYTVVTHERPDPLSRKRAKIPDACNAVKVPWMSSFKMLAAERVRFHLAP